jgi:D-3-phosphoglycerate dehydrogenase
MAITTKIVRTDRELECPLIDNYFRDSGAELVLLPDDVSEDELVAQTQDADLLLMCYTPITERVFDNATRLKGVVKYGVGIDAIDFAAATATKTPVVNIPEYAEETVAEGAFALMIALARKLMPLQRTMRRDGWAWPESAWLGSDIAGKTVGLVGVGRIGKSMARMAGAGFRARVIGYDPSASRQEMAAAGVEKIDSLHDMLAQCDFVSIHSVLKPETRHLIGDAELGCMKRSAFLINSARGALVDEAALLAVLKENRIAGAGLDVFSQEPLSLSGHPLSELFEMDNVLLSPHLTFYTHEAMQRLEEEVLQRCKELLNGQPVLVKSRDARLVSQQHGVVFDSQSGDV